MYVGIAAGFAILLGIGAAILLRSRKVMIERRRRRIERRRPDGNFSEYEKKSCAAMRKKRCHHVKCFYGKALAEINDIVVERSGRQERYVSKHILFCHP